MSGHSEHACAHEGGSLFSAEATHIRGLVFSLKIAYINGAPALVDCRLPALLMRGNVRHPAIPTPPSCGRLRCGASTRCWGGRSGCHQHGFPVRVISIIQGEVLLLMQHLMRLRRRWLDPCVRLCIWSRSAQLREVSGVL